MEQIMFKGDMDLYHQVKLMEMAKIEDKLQDEFSVVEMDLLRILDLLEVGQDAYTHKFEDELREMLDGAEEVNLGIDARLELWSELESGSIGPVIIDKDESGAGILSVGTLGSFLELLGKVLRKRYAHFVRILTSQQEKL